MVKPAASRNPNLSLHLFAILKPLYTIKPQNKKKINSPKNPSSSPIIERIKSLSAKGRNLYFCVELKSPVPNIPPLPSAYSDCISW